MRKVSLSASVFFLGFSTMLPPVNAENISKDQALVIAQMVLAEDTTHDLLVLKEKTIERPFGWVFFYVTREYEKTQDKKYLLPGTAPLVVLRANGHTDYLPTSIPPSRAIEIYEKRWEEQSRGTKSEKN
jgi:hypothetical protein